MSYFLLVVENGVPGILKNVGETWDESVKTAKDILKTQSLYDSCPTVKYLEDDAFDNGILETNNLNVDIYFMSDE